MNNHNKEHNNDINNDTKDAKSVFSKLGWEEYTLIAITLMVILIYAIHVASYTQIPSPVFGGDYYRDRGFVKNIVAGSPVWADGFYVKEIQYYPYLVFAIEAGVVKLTGASVDNVFLYFPLLILILSTFTWYMLGHRLFKNKKWALLTGLSFLLLVAWYFPKSAGVALYLTVPAFLYFFIKYEQENKLIDSILAGAMLGITALTWGGIFLGMTCTISVIIVYYFIKENIHNWKKDRQVSIFIKTFFKSILKFIKKYYLMYIVMILIAMIFFGPLILKYHLKEYNEVTKWGDTKISLLGPSWVINQLKATFFDTTNLIFILISLVATIGLVMIIATKKSFETEFILLLLLANIVVIQHQLITQPILGVSFLPEKMVYIQTLLPLFFVFGAIVIYKLVKEENAKNIVLIILLLLMITGFYYRYQQLNNDTWDKVGRGDNTYMKSLYGLSNYIEKNVDNSEAILSNDDPDLCSQYCLEEKLCLHEELMHLIM